MISYRQIKTYFITFWNYTKHIAVCKNNLANQTVHILIIRLQYDLTHTEVFRMKEHLINSAAVYTLYSTVYTPKTEAQLLNASQRGAASVAAVN